MNGKRNDDQQDPSNKSLKIPPVVYLFVLIVFIAGIQTWAIHKNAKHVIQITSELDNYQENQLKHEKSKQEVIGLAIKNAEQSFFLGSLFSSIGPLITTIVALIGALLGLRNYLDTKEKERVERAARDLKDLLTYTADDSARLRIVGVVGLQHFFMPDKKEYHLQALSSLVAMARMEKDDEVLRNIKIAVEKAVRNLSHKTLKQVTWAGVVLKNANFSNRNLSQIDFRDAVLEDADFSNSVLEKAVFVNARLNGARFNQAVLKEADLTYADLAGVSFIGAHLTEAVMNQTKVLRMNILKADLKGASFDQDTMPWPLVNNWRDATFDDGIMEKLLAVHGPAPSGIKILMLLWEIPPLVAGGTWTAVYHLVRNLRKRGVRLTVVVPWDESLIFTNPFGCDVDIISLGINIVMESSSPYQQSFSPYENSFGAYGYGSSYSGASSPYPGSFSPYGQTRYASPYSSGPAIPDIRKGTSILRITEDFKRRFVKFCRNEEFHIIHAHDWVTFGAASAAADLLKKPWVAHFHSTEFERRPNAMDTILDRLERQAATAASSIVTPSRATAEIIVNHHNIPREKITVMPNPLSVESLSPLEMGDFETRHVAFTGRVTDQKRPDLFISITKRLSEMKPDCRFPVFGDGDLLYLFSRVSGEYLLKGRLSWNERGKAFNNASAVLVTSRAEPFGMVILEAMQHHVPVFYPEHSGAAEVLSSGFKIDPEDIETTAHLVRNLLENWELWENTVELQMEDITSYISKNHEMILTELWKNLHESSALNRI